MFEGCESSFTQKAALVVHERSHTGERPFICELCDAAFTRSDALQRHRRTHKENQVKVEMGTSTDDIDNMYPVVR